MEEEKPAVRTMTREEIAAILALPVREFTFGGVQKRGRYDEETHKFYFLKDDGSLEGRIATVTFRDRAPEDTKGKAQPEEESAASKGKRSLGDILRKLAGAGGAETPSNADTKGRRERRPKKEKQPLVKSSGPVDQETKNQKKIALAVGILVVVIALCVVVLPGVIRSSLNGLQNGPTPEKHTASLDTIAVIQVTRDLIPGDLLTEDSLRRVTISAADYNQIYLNGSPLYQWTRCEDLLQTRNYVTEYIPMGLYLTYDNVSGVSPQTNNPWMGNGTGFVSVFLPLPEEILADERLSFGVVADVAIQKASQRTDASQLEQDSIDGMVISTVREDRVGYSITGLAICDLLNEQQSSLYSRFSNLMDIPSGEQITYLRRLFQNDPGEISALSPRYAVVRLTEAQARELGDLSNANVNITLTDNTDNGTDVKLQYTEGVQVLLENIRLAIQRNEEAIEALEGA